MYIEVTETKFVDVMQHYFSCEAAIMLFDCLETGDELEMVSFDPVGIQCNWNEYENWEQVTSNYSDSYIMSGYDNIQDFINDRTTVLSTDNTILIREF